MKYYKYNASLLQKLRVIEKTPLLYLLCPQFTYFKFFVKN